MWLPSRIGGSVADDLRVGKTVVDKLAAQPVRPRFARHPSEPYPVQRGSLALARHDLGIPQEGDPGTDPLRVLRDGKRSSLNIDPPRARRLARGKGPAQWLGMRLRYQ